MVELDRESQAQDDGAEQLLKRKEGLAIKVQCVTGEFGKGGG